MANCKIQSLQEKLDKGLTPSPATAAKTVVLFDHRDQVWAMQNVFETDVRAALKASIERKRLNEIEKAGGKAVTPTKG